MWDVLGIRVRLIPELCRQDLANIVRRRGYKYVRHLLDESNKTNSGSGLNGKLEELGGSEGDSKINKIFNCIAQYEKIMNIILLSEKVRMRMQMFCLMMRQTSIMV